jgi:hypothetical protein
VTLTLKSAPLADGTPVDVNVEITAADDLLAVAPEALLALFHGGNVVEFVDASTG